MEYLNLDAIAAQPLVKQIVGGILFGLIAGVVAKIILPGPEHMGWLRTIVVGILGSFLGGFVGSYFGIGGASMGWNIPAFLTAIGGALILLLLNRLVTQT